MRLRSRLAAAFITVTAMVALLAATFFAATRNIDENFVGLKHQTLGVIAELTQLRFYSQKIVSSVRAIHHFTYHHKEPPDLRPRHVAEAETFPPDGRSLQAIFEGYQSALESYSDAVHMHFPDERPILEKVKDTGDRFLAASVELVETPDRTTDHPHPPQKWDEYRKLETAFMMAIDVALDHEVQEVEERQQEVHASVSLGAAIVLLGSSGIIVIVFLIGWQVSNSVTRPVDALVAAATRIGKGEFDTPVTIHRRDEIGQLAAAFAQMAQDLKRSDAERTAAENALRKSEELFRAVVNHSPTKIHIKDADGRYMLVNREAERLFGATDAEIRGKTTHEIFPRKLADDFAEHDQAVLKNRQVIEREEEWPGEDGNRTYLTVKFPIRDVSGKISAVGAIGTDITERKRAEAALLAAKERAERSDRAKSTFLATMSHELRTPLHAVIGFSEVIRSEQFGPLGSPKYLEYVSDIHEAGAHLLELINNILDLARIEAGEFELHEEGVDLSKVIGSCANMVKEQAKAGGVAIGRDVASDLPALWADAQKLKQILLNLLSNAIKFTPAGGAVTIRAWFRLDDGHVVQVADTGIGIAPEDIPKALASFSQIDGNLNRRFAGSGLGLPLTKALTELHGGSFDLQSEAGVGTTVTLCFPATRFVSQAATGT